MKKLRWSDNMARDTSEKWPKDISNGTQEIVKEKEEDVTDDGMMTLGTQQLVHSGWTKQGIGENKKIYNIIKKLNSKMNVIESIKAIFILFYNLWKKGWFIFCNNNLILSQMLYQ